MAGGPVMSASEYRLHVSKTREAGEQAVVQLGFLPDETSDDEGITRDQPSATWRLHFDSRADYRASVEDLRKAWTASGLTVEDIPAPGKGQPGEGMPGSRPPTTPASSCRSGRPGSRVTLSWSRTGGACGTGITEGRNAEAEMIP